MSGASDLEISNYPIHRKSIEVFNRVRTMKNGWHVSQPDPLDEPRVCSMTVSYLQDAILVARCLLPNPDL